MNRKQKISDKKSFEQAGKDLLRKVHEAESDRRQEAWASWQEIEAGLSRPHTSFRLRSRFIWSVAASIAVLLSVGLYFWTDGKKDSSMSLALLENNTSSLSGNEIVLIESKEKLQLKDESSITYDVDGKSNVEEHVVKKETAEDRKEKKEEINQIIVPKGRRADITFSDGTRMYVHAFSILLYSKKIKGRLSSKARFIWMWRKTLRGHLLSKRTASMSKCLVHSLMFVLIRKMRRLP